MSEARPRPWRGGRVLVASIVAGAAVLLVAREAIDLYVELYLASSLRAYASPNTIS